MYNSTNVLTSSSCIHYVFSVCLYTHNYVGYTTDISGLNTVSSDVLTFRNSGVEENGLSLKPIETECPVKPQVLCNSLSGM